MYRKESYWKFVRSFAILALLALPFLVCGLGLTLQALGQWGIWGWLRLFGKSTPATITKVEAYDTGDELSYYIEYTYEVPGKNYPLEAREEISRYWYTHYSVSDTVKIRYLDASLLPDVSRIEGNTYERNTPSVATCWVYALTLVLCLLFLVARKPPETALEKRRIATLLNGGCVTVAVTLVGWLIELAVVAAVDVHQGIAGLGVGLLAGMLAAVLTWQPWRGRD